jgi:hypothetical protein
MFYATINTTFETIMDALRPKTYTSQAEARPYLYLTRPRGRIVRAATPTKRGSLTSDASSEKARDRRRKLYLEPLESPST